MFTVWLLLVLSVGWAHWLEKTKGLKTLMSISKFLLWVFSISLFSVLAPDLHIYTSTIGLWQATLALWLMTLGVATAMFGRVNGNGVVESHPTPGGGEP